MLFLLHPLDAPAFAYGFMLAVAAWLAHSHGGISLGRETVGPDSAWSLPA